MATIQVTNFYKVAKSIGLKKGDFSANSPKNKHGEYEDMQIVIYKRLTEEQTRELAKHYQTIVYKRNKEIRWDMPNVSQQKAGLFLIDLDEYDDERGLHPFTKLEN